MILLGPERTSAIVETLRAQFGAALSPRVEAMVRGCEAGAPPALSGSRGVKHLFLPELPTRAWWDPAAFAWTRTLEAATEDILAEAQAADQDLAYYLDDDDRAAAPGRDADGLTHPAFGWRGVIFRRAGRWNRALCQRYPRTISAITAAPLAAGDVMLSVMAPSSKIVPHTGLTNLDLTCHLALDIPPGCGIEVGDETRTWQRGKTLVFDDTFRHWAWNPSDRPRLVLLFDFWHPGLAAEEIAQLKQALALTFKAT